MLPLAAGNVSHKTFLTLTLSLQIRCQNSPSQTVSNGASQFKSFSKCTSHVGPSVGFQSEEFCCYWRVDIEKPLRSSFVWSSGIVSFCLTSCMRKDVLLHRWLPKCTVDCRTVSPAVKGWLVSISITAAQQCPRIRLIKHLFSAHTHTITSICYVMKHISKCDFLCGNNTTTVGQFTNWSPVIETVLSYCDLQSSRDKCSSYEKVSGRYRSYGIASACFKMHHIVNLISILNRRRQLALG